jgi:hypothetical protein
MIMSTKKSRPSLVFAAERLSVKHDGEIEDHYLKTTMSSLVCVLYLKRKDVDGLEVVVLTRVNQVWFSVHGHRLAGNNDHHSQQS